MLREIIEQIIARDNGIEIGAAYPESVAATELLRETDARNSVEETAGTSTVAVLNVDNGTLLLQQLAPERVELEDYSPARLREEIRAAAFPANPPRPTPDSPSQPA
jgi:hypothetical protein